MFRTKHIFVAPIVKLVFNYFALQCSPSADGEFVWCGSHDHCVYGVDAKTCTGFFRAEMKGNVLATPAIDFSRKTVPFAAPPGQTELKISSTFSTSLSRNVI
jgi:hypothetical protein